MHKLNYTVKIHKLICIMINALGNVLPYDILYSSLNIQTLHNDHIFGVTLVLDMCKLLSRFMDLCAHSVFVYVVDPLVVLVSVA